MGEIAYEEECGLQSARCLDFDPYALGTNRAFVNCLRKVASPLLWNPERFVEDSSTGKRGFFWSKCEATAAATLMLRMFSAVALADSRTQEHMRDLGIVHLAILIGEAYEKCLVNSGNTPHECPGVSWALLEIAFRYNRPISGQYDLYRQGGQSYAQFKWNALETILVCHDHHIMDVMCLGPDGFYNEPYFGPSFVLPDRRMAVGTLLQRAQWFDTSTIRHFVFPWSLNSDVELGALFVRDAIFRLKPRWVVCGDSYAVLFLAKVGYMLYNLPKRSESDQFVLDSLRESITFPPTYPPTYLSKFNPAMAKWTPLRVNISADDGHREISLDWVKIRATVMTHPQFAGHKFAYLKKEYTDGTKGLAVLMKSDPSSFVTAERNLFPRNHGIGLTDLDLKIRMYLEEPIRLVSRMPLNYRFFARNGQIYAAHLLKVTHSNQVAAIAYETVREPVSEAAAIEFVREMNFTGWGSIKFWAPRDSEDRTYILDFNPRLERQQCINGALLAGSQPELADSDPCVVFQRMAYGRQYDLQQLPLMIKAGVKIMEAMRVVNMGMVKAAQRFVAVVEGGDYVWNMHRGDEACYNLHQTNLRNFLRDWHAKFDSEEGKEL